MLKKINDEKTLESERLVSDSISPSVRKTKKIAKEAKLTATKAKQRIDNEFI